MERQKGEFIGRLLDRWMLVVARFSGVILAGAVAVGALSLRYTVNNLGIDTDTADMISDDLPFQRIYSDFKEQFPQFVDTLLVVIDAPTPESAKLAAQTLLANILDRDDLFLDAYIPGAGSFFERNQLLYLSSAELEKLSDDLARGQPLLASMMSDPGLSGLLQLLSRVAESEDLRHQRNVEPLMREFGAAVRTSLDGRMHVVSWLSLMRNQQPSISDKRRLIIVRPRMDFNRLLPAASAIQALRQFAEEEHLDIADGFNMRLTGAVALSHDEMGTVSRGALRASLLALVSVGLVLWIGLGWARLVVATVATLLLGIILTATFAAAALGQLNMISVAFAVLYIGLSVDYAIHLGLRYRELVERGHSHIHALRGSAHDVGASLLLCAVSTSIGFYAFTPTSFSGVSELGIIAGTGMFISFVLNITVFPAILTVIDKSTPHQAQSAVQGHSVAQPLINLLTRRRRTIRIASIVLTCLAVILLRYITFDYNPINLRDPASESVSTINELSAADDFSPWTISILAPDGQTARATAQRLVDLPEVDHAVTIHDFVPDRQEEKLSLIQDLSLILGPLPLALDESPPRSTRQRIDELRIYHEKLSARARRDDAEEPGRASTSKAAQLAWDVEIFLDRLQGSDETARRALLDRLEIGFLRELPAALDVLRTSLEATPFTMSDLPSNLLERWISDDGHFRIEVFPSHPLPDSTALRRFVTAVRSVAPAATGDPVIVIESGDAVVASFQQALGGALIAIALLLILVLRDIGQALLILLPLVLAAALTGAATVVLDIPFNFANVIALPLLLGLGVDNGIHIVRRVRAHSSATTALFHTSTARAIVFSALTTIFSFGNLAFTTHRGTSSMGIILTLGVLFTLFSTLIVLPAFLKGTGKTDGTQES